VKLYAEYYDCQLVSRSVRYQGRTLPGVQLPLAAADGLIGVTRWNIATARWTFTPYLDQSMRRRPELDESKSMGWANERCPDGWTAPRDVVPGVRGLFVEDDTSPVTIDVPGEFLQLCGWFGVTSEAVIRAFIADACAIKNSPDDPRADGYNTNGLHSQYAAEDYMNTAFGPGADIKAVVVCRLDNEDEDDETEECPKITIENHRVRLRSASTRN